MAGSAEQTKEVLLTITEWFHGRFRTEHVFAKDNKPSEVESRLSIVKSTSSRSSV